jgi:hypothetical protein
LVEQPGKLQRRRIRRDRQAGPLLEPMDASVGRERIGRNGGTGVLPSDRSGNRVSRPAIPEHDALTFVRDSDPRHVGRRGARRAERFVDALLGSLPDLVHVELNPPGPRVVHGLGALRGRDRAAFLVEEHAARAGGAVVDRCHELGGHR